MVACSYIPCCLWFEASLGKMLVRPPSQQKRGLKWLECLPSKCEAEFKLQCHKKKKRKK
jgi:hypothetical protein